MSILEDAQVDNGTIRVGGGVAAGATDSGNPTKVGGKYNATLPTLTDGQRGDMQLTDRAGVIVEGNVASAATDIGRPVKVGGKYNSTLPTLTNGQRGDIQVEVNGAQLISHRHSFLNIADTVSQVIKSGAGFLHAIIVAKAAAGTVTVYDNTAGSGTKIVTLKASIVEGTYTFNCNFANGLYVIPGAATDLTFVYR